MRVPIARVGAGLVAILLTIPPVAPAAAQEPDATSGAPKPERPKPKPRRAREAPPAARDAARDAAKGAAPEKAAPSPPPPPALPVASYVEAAATTIIAEQSCPGLRLNAGQLTNLRLAARIAPAQEAPLEEQLRARAVEVRQRLAGDGREAWCAETVAAYGPAGTLAKGLLADGSRPPGR